MFAGRTELKKVDDTIFIDRNPRIFALVLDYLRNNQCEMQFESADTKRLFDYELKYWRLDEYK